MIPEASHAVTPRNCILAIAMTVMAGGGGALGASQNFQPTFRSICGECREVYHGFPGIFPLEFSLQT